MPAMQSLAGFLGWTFDAFDFFVLVFTVSAIAKDFGRSIPAIALTITASLVTRPVGAFVFGLLADRYGRRPVLMANIVFYSADGSRFRFCAQLRDLSSLCGCSMASAWAATGAWAHRSRWNRCLSKWRGFVSGFLQQGYAIGNLLAAHRLLHGFPALGLACDVFRRSHPGGCHAVHLHAGQGIRSLASSAYRLGHLPRRDLRQLAPVSVPGRFDGDDELHLARHAGFVPDVSPAAAPFRCDNATAFVSAISMVGAIVGRLVFGHFSDRLGRRVPWFGGAARRRGDSAVDSGRRTGPLIMLGAFLMQLMVQGAWGVIPAHINELSPPQLRGFFPGFAYQIGVLIASSIAYIEAVLAEHFSYATSMGVLAAVVLLVGAV